MKEFMVCFYEDIDGILNNGTPVRQSKGDLIKVSEKEMFDWLEYAHRFNKLIAIYSATMVCDFT